MLKLTIFGCILAVAIASDQTPFETIFEWDYIDYNWPSTDALTQALASGNYIPKNNVITGIKLWKDKLYLTIPRLNNGVPATLAVASATPVNGVTNPLLDPYPSWDMQTKGDCKAFQFVQSMEIDPLGRMWVLDTGRTGTMSEKPVSQCPPRLVILDLENDSSILLTYVFPDEVVLHASVLLNDIVIDHDDGGTAFIADSQTVDPGIIVYSLKENRSWKMRHNGSMRIQADAVNIIINGTTIFAPYDVDGIALSPPGPERLLYYSPVSSFHIYSILASVLKNSSLVDIDEYVTDLGLKTSQTDGMAMSNRGVLYLGLLNDDSIAMWNTKTGTSVTTDLKRIFRDPVHSKWPDTFAFDEDGRLWYVANNLLNYINGTVDVTTPNYRVLSGTVHAKNYQYLEDGTAPEYPAISGAANHTGSPECVMMP